MSKRNLTDLFFMLRNNVLYNKNIYSDSQHSDNVALLNSASDNGNHLEQPVWIGRYEEIHYLLSKIQKRTDDLLGIQSSTARSVLSEDAENEQKIEVLAKEISKLISTCHGQMKSIKSFSRGNNNLERVLLQNVERSLLISLQKVTEKFRKSQSVYMEEQHSLLKKSKAFFEPLSTNVEGLSNNSVETFDNFLNMDVPSSIKAFDYENDDDKLDEYFQLPATGISINQKQMMLIESDNTKMIHSREQEVKQIVNSIVDLNVIFKDLSQLVQEQGTILDRIDYNIETTQTRVSEGYKQLQKAEKYQRKNRKMVCIIILASMIMFMIILTIFTKF